MRGIYLRSYDLLPEFLKKRINPLEFAIRAFVRSARPQASAVPGPDAGTEVPVILDAGAGEVRFRNDFPGGRYIAIDSAIGDLEWDYSRVDVIGDLAAVPFADESADIALNIQVLEHVPDPEVVATELCRVLKTGGSLFLTAPQGWHEHQQPNDFFRFTQYSLRRLISGAGFQDIEIAPMGGYFHYLGHRLTYIPKVLFAERQSWVRWLLLPLEICALVIFCFLGPICCYYLDYLDSKKEFTLCYRCRARKR